MPPAEEATPAPKFDYKERVAQRQAGFEKAAITPMIEIETEENRIVFEGMVLMWSARPLGQVAISSTLK